MNNNEALRTVMGNLPTEIQYLEMLESKLRHTPECAPFRMGVKVFDAGIDLCETANCGYVQYAIQVYNYGGNVSTVGVQKALKIGVPEYDGQIRVVSGANPYPENSFLSLGFLKDLERAIR